MSEQAKKLSNNFPYIGLVAGDNTLSFFVIAERVVLLSSSSFLKVLRGLMAAYYSFNIQYPQTLSQPLIFFQHFLFSVKEDTLPPAIIRFISCVDKL